MGANAAFSDHAPHKHFLSVNHFPPCSALLKPRMLGFLKNLNVEKEERNGKVPWLVWLSWLEYCPIHQKVAGSIPSQVTY